MITPRAVSRVNHVGISVADMDRSLTFYRDLLGLEQVLDLDVGNEPDLDAVVEMTGVEGRVVFLDAGDTRVELWCYAIPVGEQLPGGHKPADHGVSHISFDVPDVDEMHRKLVEASISVTTTPKDLGIHKTFYARGPDGEYLEFVEDRSDRAMLQRATERSDAHRQMRGATS